MAKKQTSWKTKGMNQDLSVSAFNPEFSFENRNLRLSTNEGNTLMSWVNEKGTSEVMTEVVTEGEPVLVPIALSGVAIGTAVIDHTLVVFTTQNISKEKYYGDIIKPDSIYLLKYSNTAKHDMEITELYSGNLNFSTKAPLETMVSYEAENIKKVYWTDDRNQPRLINIAASAEERSKWENNTGALDYFFDFVPSLQFNESVAISKVASGGGLFAPGVIQYCFTYINKHGQQSNVVWASPLYYLSHGDRGASPEERVTNSFHIEITSAETTFDYIRLYSIQRTSLNTTPYVRLIDDLPINSNGTVTYTDNGTTGASLDPTELLYVGGHEITAKTMAEKDNTLFLGNISQSDTKLAALKEYFFNHQANINFYNDGVKKSLTMNHTTGVYGYTHQLNKNQQEITTFKGGEHYRFGFQLQRKTGEWTDPIFIGDKTNDKYPSTNVFTDVVNLTYAKSQIGLGGSGFDFSEFKMIRPVIVYPNIGDRKVLCQGVLNPTVFNAMDRIDKSPYAQASWYFRPYLVNGKVRTLPFRPTEGLSIDASDSIPGTLEPAFVDLGDSYFENKEMLLAWINESKTDLLDGHTAGKNLKTILRNGLIKYQYNNNIAITRQDADINLDQTSIIQGSFQISGAVVIKYANDLGIQEDDSQEIVLFILGSQGPAVNTGITYEYSNGIDSNKTYYTTVAMPVYKELQLGGIGGKEYLYANPPTNDFEGTTYTLNFSVTNANATNANDLQDKKTGHITFTVKKDRGGINDGDDLYSYVPKVGRLGSKVEFCHYTPIVSEGSCGTGASSTLKSVEIQGSVDLYDGIFNKTENVHMITAEEDFIGWMNGVEVPIRSNTQFYIDQSIITLNSPDIDFDTEVQMYGSEGLGLRIVGAIPITAAASDCDITTKSSMIAADAEITMGEGFIFSPIKTTISKFGRGKLGRNMYYSNIAPNAGKHLVGEYMWNDSFIMPEDTDDEGRLTVKTLGDLVDFMVFPWHRSGSLNNDFRGTDEASSLLRAKKESNLLYSLNTEYFQTHNLSSVNFADISLQIHLTENDYITNIRLPRQKDSDDYSEINYYPNIDKVLYNENGYKPRFYTEDTSIEGDVKVLNTPVSMKYKSTSHAVIALNAGSNNAVPILPYVNTGSESVGVYEKTGTDERTFWGDKPEFSQSGVSDQSLFLNGSSGHVGLDLLWIGEIYKEPSNAFGGNTLEAIDKCQWHVAGESVKLFEGGQNPTLYWTIGDTYYQRYDCLKTYAFTPEDTNQLVEILSFMCESHVNIDGRYDKNRGQLDNTNMSPLNFNLLNSVYSQKNNFFIYRGIDHDKNASLSYPNHIWYSKTKTAGADVDLWTNVTLANSLEMDGDKGEINSLNRFNNQLISFQDTGISQVLYNENVQISSTEGVPIEIANSGKVQGKRYISDTIGCSNKWSIAQTPFGLYFMDSTDKSIYLFNGELRNLSVQNGFNSWSKRNIPVPGIPWEPDTFGNFVSYYDKQNQDVLFINEDSALAFSEKVGAFTSFYDYGYTPYFCNLDDTGIWVKPYIPAPGSSESLNTYLWRHQAGDYCNFFGENKPYSMILVGNAEPQTDKTFTNLDFRACVDGEGKMVDSAVVSGEQRYAPYLPFDALETWNEYQHGIAHLQNKWGHDLMKHHTIDNTATLKRKFRIWRCDIPRDNASNIDVFDFTFDNTFHPSDKVLHPMDRMRNTWLYLRLAKEAAESNKVLNRAEIHDIRMTYYN